MFPGNGIDIPNTDTLKWLKLPNVSYGGDPSIRLYPGIVISISH